HHPTPTWVCLVTPAATASPKISRIIPAAQRSSFRNSGGPHLQQPRQFVGGQLLHLRQHAGPAFLVLDRPQGVCNDRRISQRRRAYRLATSSAIWPTRCRRPGGKFSHA